MNERVCLEEDELKDLITSYNRKKINVKENGQCMVLAAAIATGETVRMLKACVQHWFEKKDFTPNGLSTSQWKTVLRRYCSCPTGNTSLPPEFWGFREFFYAFSKCTNKPIYVIQKMGHHYGISKHNWQNFDRDLTEECPLLKHELAELRHANLMQWENNHYWAYEFAPESIDYCDIGCETNNIRDVMFTCCCKRICNECLIRSYENYPRRCIFCRTEKQRKARVVHQNGFDVYLFKVPPPQKISYPSSTWMIHNGFRRRKLLLGDFIWVNSVTKENYDFDTLARKYYFQGKWIESAHKDYEAKQGQIVQQDQIMVHRQERLDEIEPTQVVHEEHVHEQVMVVTKLKNMFNRNNYKLLASDFTVSIVYMKKSFVYCDKCGGPMNTHKVQGACFDRKKDPFFFKQLYRSGKDKIEKTAEMIRKNKVFKSAEYDEKLFIARQIFKLLYSILNENLV